MNETPKATQLGLKVGDPVVFVSKSGALHNCTVLAIEDQPERLALSGPNDDTMWYGASKLPALTNRRGSIVGHVATRKLCEATQQDFRRLADKTGGALLDLLIDFDNEPEGFDISPEQLKQLRQAFHAFASLISMRHRCAALTHPANKPSPCSI